MADSTNVPGRTLVSLEEAGGIRSDLEVRIAEDGGWGGRGPSCSRLGIASMESAASG